MVIQNRIEPAGRPPAAFLELVEAMVLRLRLEAGRVAAEMPGSAARFSVEPILREFLDRLERSRPRIARRWRRRMASPLRGGPSALPAPFRDVDLDDPAALRTIDLARVHGPALREFGADEDLQSGLSDGHGSSAFLPQRLFPTVSMPVSIPPVRGLKVKLSGLRSPERDPAKLTATAFGYSSDGRMHLGRPLQLGRLQDFEDGVFRPSRPMHYFVFVPQGSRPTVYTVAMSVSGGMDRETQRLERRMVQRMLRELRQILSAALGWPEKGPLGSQGGLYGATCCRLFTSSLRVMRDWANLDDLGSTELQLTVQDPAASWKDGPRLTSRAVGANGGLEVCWRAELV